MLHDRILWILRNLANEIQQARLSRGRWQLAALDGPTEVHGTVSAAVVAQACRQADPTAPTRRHEALCPVPESFWPSNVRWTHLGARDRDNVYTRECYQEACLHETGVGEVILGSVTWRNVAVTTLAHIQRPEYLPQQDAPIAFSADDLSDLCRRVVNGFQGMQGLLGDGGMAYVNGSWWRTIGQACWAMAFPAARAQLLRELHSSNCGVEGIQLLVDWWDGRYAALRDSTGTELQRSDLLGPQVAAAHARTIMLDVVHETRRDMWATQHAPLRMDHLQPGMDIHRLVVNRILRQAAAVNGYQNTPTADDLRMTMTDDLTAEEAWNERTRWLPEAWLPAHAFARTGSQPARPDFAAAATRSSQDGATGVDEGRANAETPGGAGDESAGHGPWEAGPHRLFTGAAWEASERQRWLNKLEECWDMIQTNRATGRSLTRNEYTWSEGINCLLWNTCSPPGRTELLAFMRVRHMDERGVQVLVAWWDALGVSTLEGALAMIVNEARVRSYIGTPGNPPRYLPIRTPVRQCDYLDPPLQEHIMSLADPHNWLHSSLLLPPRDPGAPPLPAPAPLPPTPRIDIQAIQREVEQVAEGHQVHNMVMHQVREEALRRVSRYDGQLTDDGTVERHAASVLYTAMRDWHDIRRDPLMWLSDLGALWLLLPCHFRGLIPAAAIRAIQIEPARAVARRFGELGITTPGALVQMVRQLGSRPPVPTPYQPFSPDTVRAIFDDITRRGNPFQADAVDVIGAAPDNGMGLLFPLIHVLFDAADPPQGLGSASQGPTNVQSAWKTLAARPIRAAVGTVSVNDVPSTGCVTEPRPVLFAASTSAGAPEAITTKEGGGGGGTDPDGEGEGGGPDRHEGSDGGRPDSPPAGVGSEGQGGDGAESFSTSVYESFLQRDPPTQEGQSLVERARAFRTECDRAEREAREDPIIANGRTGEGDREQ